MVTEMFPCYSRVTSVVSVRIRNLPVEKQFKQLSLSDILFLSSRFVHSDEPVPDEIEVDDVSGLVYLGFIEIALKLINFTFLARY